MQLRARQRPCRCGARIYWQHPYPPTKDGVKDPPRNADGTEHLCPLRKKGPEGDGDVGKWGMTRDTFILALLRQGVPRSQLDKLNIGELAKLYQLKKKDDAPKDIEHSPDELEPPEEEAPKEEKEGDHSKHRLEAELRELLADGHVVWLCGDAGSGKTFSGEVVGKQLGMEVIRIPCGPQTVKSEIFGYTNAANGEYVPGLLWMAIQKARAGVKTLVIWDEADCINPGVAKNVHGCWDGSVLTFPNGETLRVRDEVSQMVCANTWGRPTPQYPNANTMDAAMMTRFTKMAWGYDEAFERHLYKDIPDQVAIGQKIRHACQMHGIKTISVTMRTFDAMRKFHAKGKSTAYMLLRTVWTGASKDDAHKVAGAVGLTVPEEAKQQWQ